MPPIEDLLRGELKRVADAVQPGQLRPLRMPVPARRWHRRLLPVAAAAAVIAVAVAAVLVVRPKPVPPAAPGPAAIPGYYLTFTIVTDKLVKYVPASAGNRNLPVTEAVIRDSATGQITGTVKILTDFFPAPVTVAAAPDDRSFIIGTYEGRDEEYRFFRLPISADGKPGHLTELPAYPIPTGVFVTVTGIALSPDGTLLAVSSTYRVNGQNGHATSERAAVDVINLVTGTVRTWTAATQQGDDYEPGPPSWVDGNRMIAFTLRALSANGHTTMEGVRLLDTEASGGNLADSRTIMSPKAVSGTIQSVLITPDGRDVLVATSRDVPSGGNGGGTVIAQIAEVPAAGRGPVRVLRTETARYTVNTKGYLDDTSQVLSLDPTGRYALVQGFQFGWLDLDLGRFTPLPPYSSKAAVYGAW